MSVTAPPQASSSGVSFFVEGVPRPQGRKSAITRHGRTVVVESGRALLRPWREAIAGAASRACPEPLAGPVRVELVFAMPRPLAHFVAGDRARPLRDAAPTHHSTRPDLDKLTRAVLDALSGTAIADDGLVAHLEALKVFGDPAGVTVYVGAIEARA